jgi:hypothetical protein
MAKTFYATADSDEGRIVVNATIEKFVSERAAREWLLYVYRDALDEFDVEIVPGTFGDCWMKLLGKPKIGDRWLAPFSYRQLHIDRPGSHPGGNFFWITPRPDVLVAVLTPKE